MTYHLELLDDQKILISEESSIVSDSPIPIPAVGDYIETSDTGVWKVSRRTFYYWESPEDQQTKASLICEPIK